METLGIVEVTKLVGCSKTHLLTCARRGTLKSHRVTRGTIEVLRFYRRDVEAFIGAHIKGNNKACRKNKNTLVGSKILKRGYVLIRMPNHPRADNDGYVPEQYLVLEEKLGRNLTKKEVVHHVDHNRKNNHPDNLTLFSSQSEHMKTAHGFTLFIEKKVMHRPDLMQKIRDLIENYEASSTLPPIPSCPSVIL